MKVQNTDVILTAMQMSYQLSGLNGRFKTGESIPAAGGPLSCRV